MDTIDMTIRLPEALHGEARRLALAQDITMGQLVRDLLAREVARRHRARPPVRADERLVAPLRARLAGDLAHASDWGDLQRRLRARGYVLRAAGGGLALHDWPGNRRLCKASDLGFSYSRLMSRFRAPFPDIPPLGVAAPRAPALRHGDRAGDAEDEDIELIEPFDPVAPFAP